MKTKKQDHENPFHDMVVKDQEFMALDEVKADSKNRVSLGRKVRLKAKFYKVFQNALGQIILDPMETIPAHEAWLFKNKKAHESVLNGLNEARTGKLLKSPENFSKYVDKE
jgi:hypothetical protein